jgi:hypothetical protein
MEIWALEHKIIINIYYPLIQFIIGLTIVIIQNQLTRTRKKLISETQNRIYDKSPEGEKSEALKKAQSFKMQIQNKYFNYYLDQQAWKGFGWGLITTSIFFLLIIMQSDHYTL